LFGEAGAIDRVDAAESQPIQARGVHPVRAVLLTGGRGTRLAPYTTVLPKPLLPLGDYPILEICVRRLAHFGFTDLIFCTGFLSHLIEAYFGDGSRFGIRIQYSKEQAPLGT